MTRTSRRGNRWLLSLRACVYRSFLPVPRANHVRLPPVPPNNQQCPVLVLPYYSGLSEKIRRLGHSLNFNVRFKSSCNLRSIVRSDKIKVPFDSRPGVVYEIKCGCNASYIGETGNTLFRRFDQHMSNVLTYKNAERRLNGEPTIGPGRPPKIEPRKAMATRSKPPWSLSTPLSAHSTHD
ncbi:hypothetical protein M514_09037 [Trichuris suis]|uniref:GIY-YIG domain-containing protein n=1 Tax=Trichuris suis TaxID=68888 RepID=A0A085LYN1_9BILA|nr:hypothetical protein M513_09037 [Trichuris suis]KFD62552.1 hypothetical protein M514_09037 [Trichuris suis]